VTVNIARKRDALSFAVKRLKVVIIFRIG